MNPIANLPATQNLNRPQQSQGYNRQYFGGDEVDQFELSQEAEEAAAEEQNKKKIWAYAAGIGAAIVAGAAVLLGLRATGHATWAKLGNNENSLTGLTKLSKTQGDTVKKGATLAEGAMKGTLSGGSWNGISTSITGSASQYNNIIFIGKKENFDALKEKITDSAVNGKLQHTAYETFEKLKDSINTYLNDDKAAIIVDTDLRNADGGSVYERIKKYWDESNSAGGETKAEEKKEEETTITTTETDGGTGSVKDTTQDEAAKVKAKKKEDMKAIDEAINNKQAQVLNNELVKEDGENITFTIAENQTKKYTMKATSYAPNETDKADLPAGSKKIVWNSDHMYYIENKDGTISVKELTEPAKPKVETPKVETPKVETPAVTPAPANGNQADGQKTVTPEAGTQTPAVTPDVTPAVNTVGGQKPPTASGAAPTGEKPDETPTTGEKPASGQRQLMEELSKSTPLKATEFPSIQKTLDDSQTSVVAADEKTKVVDSTTTGTTVDGQQAVNTVTGNAGEPKTKPVEPTATGNTGGTSEGGKQTVDEHPVVTPASTVQDGGSNPKLDKTKESTPNTAVQNPAANENQNQGGNTGAGAGTNTTDQSNPSANETKATNPSNQAAKESSDSEVDEVENNTKK